MENKAGERPVLKATESRKGAIRGKEGRRGRREKGERKGGVKYALCCMQMSQ